jgi:hypothetical protein
MQALNALPPALLEELPEPDELGLLPQAVARVATATTAIVTENALRKGVSFGVFRFPIAG